MTTNILLPYEIINYILKFASNPSHLYYLQVNYTTGKLFYKHNMQHIKFTKLQITPIQFISQHLFFNHQVFQLNSFLIHNFIYKKNFDNTLFIFYKFRSTSTIKGTLIYNQIYHQLINYSLYSSLKHTNGWCYDMVLEYTFL